MPELDKLLQGAIAFVVVIVLLVVGGLVMGSFKDTVNTGSNTLNASADGATTVVMATGTGTLGHG